MKQRREHRLAFRLNDQEKAIVDRIAEQKDVPISWLFREFLKKEAARVEAGSH